MREYFKNVSDDKATKTNLYKGKEEYYQWLKKEIYALIHPYNINPVCIYGDTDSLMIDSNSNDFDQVMKLGVKVIRKYSLFTKE